MDFAKTEVDSSGENGPRASPRHTKTKFIQRCGAAASVSSCLRAAEGAEADRADNKHWSQKAKRRRIRRPLPHRPSSQQRSTRGNHQDSKQSDRIGSWCPVGLSSEGASAGLCGARPKAPAARRTRMLCKREGDDHNSRLEVRCKYHRGMTGHRACQLQPGKTHLGVAHLAPTPSTRRVHVLQAGAHLCPRHAYPRPHASPKDVRLSSPPSPRPLACTSHAPHPPLSLPSPATHLRSSQRSGGPIALATTRSSGT